MSLSVFLALLAILLAAVTHSGCSGASTPLAPSITTQSASQTVIAGQAATFSIAATGTPPLNYQWHKNGTAISGATSPTYTTPVTTVADNGAQFAVRVSNTAGSETSNLTILTVTVPPAFPRAEGGGARSVGGRGGMVYLVTNTEDSGPGSLRACVEATGPRTCIFRTGGTISLLSSLRISDPFITIAGQTAPGGGIQLRGPSGANAPGNPSLLVTTHDVVVQYLRVRRGHNRGEICNRLPWSCGASVEILSNSASHDPYNIVFDHISAQWSNYDALIVLGSGTTPKPRSFTVSHSILGEAVAGAGQVVGANFSGYSGKGPAAPDGMTDLDVHHNLFAGASHRLPLMAVKSGRLVNNYVYGWTYYPMRHKGFRDFVNNYFRLRTGQLMPTREIQAWTTNDRNDTSFAPSFYVTGNVGPNDPLGASNWVLMTALATNQSAGEASSPLSTTYQRSSPISMPPDYIPITADPVATVITGMLNSARLAPYDGVGASRKLDCAGRWEDARDSVDTRIVNAVANGTTLFGSFTYSSLSTSPRSQFDLGGWPSLAAGTACADSNNNGLPDAWESHWASEFGLGSTLDSSGFNFGDGYTNLEHYIHGVNPSP